MTRQRSAIEWQDIVASTFVVGTDLVECDYLSVQEAIDNLPSEGGSIFILPGTYRPTASIQLPNKPVNICGSGNSTVFDLGANVISLFKTPALLTEERIYDLREFKILGTAILDQRGFEYQDAASFARFYVCRVKTQDLYNPIYVSDAALRLVKDTVSWFEDCEFTAPDMGILGNPQLLKTLSPGQAGIYALSFWMRDCYCWAPTEFSLLGWEINFDGDVIAGECQFLMIPGGASVLNDFDMIRCHVQAGHQTNVVHTLDIYPASWWGLGHMAMSEIWNIELTITNGYYDITDVYISQRSKIIVASNINIGVRIHDIKWAGSDPPDYLIDVIAGAFPVIISHCKLNEGTVASVRLANSGNIITDSAFSGPAKTVVETGAADGNLIQSCIGLLGGTGMTIIGPTTVIDGAKLATKSSTTTAALVEIVPQIQNQNGLQGVGKIKNTDGANSLDVKESFTDAFGVTSTLTTTVAPGNFLPLNLGIDIGTGSPPYVSYKAEVIDTVAGNHATYVARFTSQGAL